MDISKIEKAFYWVMFVLGMVFLGTALFMKSGLDVAVRTVFGGLMTMSALSEIYPGIVIKIIRRISSVIISACTGLTRKLKRLRRREAVNEADIVNTKRL